MATVLKFADYFYGFIAAHQNNKRRPDSRRKKYRTVISLRMWRRYRKGKKVKVME